MIIANPNGLSINGAGFINASAVTLTTGTANIVNGSVNSLSINGGDISISENGLDTTTVDSTYIYTHYLKLNAQINAQNLDIKLGLNEIDTTSKNVTTSSNSGDTTNLLLDSSALGGMYANRITLVGTDKGLGVNLPAEVLASTQNITITNDGRIVLQKLSANDDIDIKSTNGDIELNDNLYTQTALSLQSDETVSINSGIIASKNQIDIKSKVE